MLKKWVFDKNGEKYNFNVYEFSEFNDDILKVIILEANNGKRVKKSSKKAGGNEYGKFLTFSKIQKGKRTVSYINNVNCGFDIETTNYVGSDGARAFMWQWQFSINNNVIIGHYWYEFLALLGILENIKFKDTHRLVVWVANLGFEWQFVKHLLEVTDSFFKEEREPVYITHNTFIVFRECLSWGGSLAKLANDYTRLYKMVGDLDYAKFRMPNNCNLNSKEAMYCYMDVLILAEFSKFFNITYWVKGKDPITITSALRNKVKDKIGKNKLKMVQYAVMKCMPSTECEYNILMNYVYRGGYVHGNILYTDEILIAKKLGKKIRSFDITSSYPASAAHKGFPMIWEVGYCEDENDLFSYIQDDFAFYGCFKFKGLRSITAHSIESVSKTLEYNASSVERKKFLENVTLDNGRIRSVDNDEWVTVYLTDLDFLVYKMYYDWDEMNLVGELKISKKRPLPKYLLDVLFDSYTLKAQLKKEGKSYAIEKTYVNSLYGMCVTRRNVQNIKWVDGAIVKEESNEDWDAYKKKQVLSPYWGIYISAYSRYKLLAMCRKIEKAGGVVLYCDTDSIKYIENDSETIVEVFEADNKKIELINEKLANAHNLDVDFYKDLGGWDFEEDIDKIKYLGAKRYIFTYHKNGIKKYNVTVAGLPKHAYLKEYGYNDLLFFSNFANGLKIKGCKLASVYNDFGCDYTAGNEVIHEYSNVALVESDFTMKLDGDWISLVYMLANSAKERRIYG